MDKVVDTVQYGIAMAAQQQIWDDDQGVIFTAPPVIDSIVSPRLAFPLQCQLPARQQYCVGTHLALVGDAAHSVHPMAGQGLNLGLQDTVALANVVTKAISAGMSPGTFLPEYQASRRQQVNLTVSGIHLLQRLFMGQSPAAKHLKSFGMSLLQNVGPARRAVVQAATHGI
jgi:2-polyprenylphenol 6-hydroxylase